MGSALYEREKMNWAREGESKAVEGTLEEMKRVKK
jgi:hypothetical protein